MRSEEDKVDELLALEGPDEIDRVEGVKSVGGGEIEKLSPKEIRTRQQTLSRLMHTGLSDDEIYEQLEAEGWELTHARFKQLKEKLFAKWSAEDNERAPALKGAARRRIYQHIKAAGALGQYNAVAGLEKTLSLIEGTAVDENTAEPASARQINAIVMIMGDLSPEKAMELVASEIERSNPGAKLPPAQGPTINVTKKS